MILPLLQYPDERLRQISKPIEDINDEIRELASSMLETMYANEGIGLAAPQVGEFVRMVVIDLALPEDMTPEEIREEGLPEGIAMPLILVNPELTLSGGTTKSEEGCLSVPNSYRASVPRRTAARLKALDLEGNVMEMDTDGLFAICLQHEIDHLDGKLFIDYISRLKLNLYKASLRKQSQA